MRTIAAALTTAQKSLNAKPTLALVIGSTTLTTYLMSYTYRQRERRHNQCDEYNHPKPFLI